MGHLGWSACWLGVARGALQRLVRHLSTQRAHDLDPVARDLRLEQVVRDLRSAALNFHNDKVLAAIGSLSLLDRSVRLVGDPEG